MSVANQQPPSLGFRAKSLAYFERHELQFSIAFFLGGFLFDVLTLSEIDDPLTIVQQMAYLVVVGGIIYVDFVRESVPGAFQFPKALERWWGFRDFLQHFLLGSLFSIYSLFFLKSASLFSSVLFVFFLLVVMVANELKFVQQRGLNTRIALWAICLFCFYSLLFPILLTFVGWIPFLLAFTLTIASIVLIYRGLLRHVPEPELKRRLLLPGFGTAGIFLALYLMGLIPPVPLAVVKMGVYHSIEKVKKGYVLTEQRSLWNFYTPDSYLQKEIVPELPVSVAPDGNSYLPVNDRYVLFHEKPWWKFWRTGDQDFRALQGDKIHFFVAIFSPGRFADTVFVRWQYFDSKRGWQGSDRLPLQVTGGRKEGFRGVATKQNFAFGTGEWRVSVETSDGREIGRLYFNVTIDDSTLAERPYYFELY
jgi:hypothetical protein